MTRWTTLIVGAGGHGQVVADILLQVNDKQGVGTTAVESFAFVDDDSTLVGERFLDLPVVGTLDDLRKLSAESHVVAIGHNRVRARVFRELLERKSKLLSAVHPSTVVASSAEIGKGVVICAGVVVNPLAELSDGVILNTACTVDHHARVGPFAHIAPGAHLGGNVTVGEGVLIGIGASIVPGVTIGAWAVIGAGAAVVRDVEADVVVVGVPARATAPTAPTGSLGDVKGD